MKDVKSGKGRKVVEREVDTHKKKKCRMKDG